MDSSIADSGTVRMGNTVDFEGQEYPFYGGLDGSTPYENALKQIQVRIKGPGCGPHGLVIFGKRAVGQIRLLDEPLVEWTITFEERTS